MILRNPRATLERLRGTLWVMPTVAVLVSVALAVLLVRVEVSPDGIGGNLLFTGGADGARGLLQATISSVITVTSLTFSLTVVSLQLASSQFSPRLLRTFLRDRGTQATLSTFLATAVYCVMVLRTIRASADEREEFVPSLAVTLAMVLLVASIGVLVYFLNHITSQIRVDTMLRNVDSQSGQVIDHVYPDPHPGTDEPGRPDPPGQASMLLASKSGFVQGISADTLVRLAEKHGISIMMTTATGEVLIAGTPMAWVWPLQPEGPLPDVGELTRGVVETLTLGHERTIAQDVPFGFRQLVDVASKALSPGVNDPTTAVQAISHLNHLLCRVAGRRTGDQVHLDDAGRPLVRIRRMYFEEILDLACGQIRRYGSSEPDVACELLQMLLDVGGCCRSTDDRESVRRQIDLIVAAAERSLDEPADVARVHRVAEAARTASRRTWRPGATAASVADGPDGGPD